MYGHITPPSNRAIPPPPGLSSHQASLLVLVLIVVFSRKFTPYIFLVTEFGRCRLR